MNGGDTFFFIGPETAHPHLWIVVSDPTIDPEQVLIINVTTRTDPSDDACLLRPGDHPFIDQDTYVYYGKARVQSLSQLQSAQDCKMLDMQEPLSQDVLKRIREAAIDSGYIMLKHRQILIDQELVG